ncbi:hypothetical protein [Streptomyces sp. NPDC002851]
MDVAGLIAWVLAALGGFVLLARWIAHGGLRQQKTGPTRFPAPLVFGHFLLAAVGLVVWIVYLVADSTSLAWTGFGLLVVVALLGFTMFARWLPVRGTAAAGPDGGPAESHLPQRIVLGHGLFGAATLVVVLLAALGV